MPQNDTYGEISAEEQAVLRMAASKCLTCGMLATIDPAFHASRYAHAPLIRDERGDMRQWDGGGWIVVDTKSSASRQHYIDTGRYLRPGEAWEV